MNSSLCRAASALLLVLAFVPGRAAAQIIVIDDLILLQSRQQKQAEQRRHRHLEPPGGENLLPPSPGADEPRLGEGRHIPPPAPLALSRHGKHRVHREREVQLHPGAAPGPQSEESPLAGPVEVPPEDGGPAGGLSLEAATDRLLARNTDLAAMYQDIPKARGEVLTAGLRNNPLLFVDVNNIPYGHFSPQRPASTNYDLTLIQPLDVNGKRRFRIRAAQEAQTVLEAQFQDAVRLKMGRLDEVFIDVLEAQQAVESLRSGLARLKAMEEAARSLAERGRLADIRTLSVERANGELALLRAEATLLQARRGLALLLGIPGEQAACLRVVGPLHDRAPPPPCVKELIDIALQMRPDLLAYRLGMNRARADLRRENAEAVDDIFLFYTPFTANDYSPQGKQSATGWGLSVLFSLPFFDRNQGEIARARVNVTQTQLDLEDLERRVVNEVQNAALEYAVSGEAVQEYEREILPGARALRDEQDRLFAGGQAGFASWLEAQKEYGEVVRDYLETLVYHRRTMLRLNSAVGQRLLP